MILEAVFCPCIFNREGEEVYSSVKTLLGLVVNVNAQHLDRHGGYHPELCLKAQNQIGKSVHFEVYIVCGREPGSHAENWFGPECTKPVAALGHGNASNIDFAATFCGRDQYLCGQSGMSNTE